MQQRYTQDRPFIIDGVAHGYDFSPCNQAAESTPERTARFGQFAYQLGHASVESSAPGYLLTLEEFTSRWHAEDLAHAMFVESDIDMAVYHSVEISSFFRDGASRFDTGVALKRAAPDRVLLYGCIDTFGDDVRALDQMEMMATEGVSGFKFYPSNGFYDSRSNQLLTMFYDTPERAFKFFDKARSLNVTHLAFHKAQPVGPGPTDAVGVQDISSAAMAFPDMTFEIVHDGWAFLEESALQYMIHENIYANFECVVNLIVRQPRKFAHILGTLMQHGGDDRLLFATGCAVNHPNPIIEAFLNFQMPQDLVDGFGFAQLTPETKAKFLGGNMARLHGIDIPAVSEKIATDRWSKLRANGKPAPWSAHRRRLSAPDYPDDHRGIRSPTASVA
jgi:predicted TIM-barrel fold metal-dependent hydrolase